MRTVIGARDLEGSPLITWGGNVDCRCSTFISQKHFVLYRIYVTQVPGRSAKLLGRLYFRTNIYPCLRWRPWLLLSGLWPQKRHRLIPLEPALNNECDQFSDHWFRLPLGFKNHRQSTNITEKLQPKNTNEIQTWPRHPSAIKKSNTLF